MDRPSPPTPLQQVRSAVKANLLPGMVLWAGLVALTLAYAWSPAVQAGLSHWGAVKLAWGHPFSFATYAMFAVLVPELLGIAVLRQRVRSTLLADMAYATLVFGSIGITVDLFYALQVSLFGEGNDGATIAKKMLLDQFVYSPMTNFAVIALFAWREDGFRASAWQRIFSADFLSSRYLPLLVALWCVWIPGVVAIYLMPTALQFPVASLILSFWVLIFKFMRKV
ncbi:MAG: hypothetical protein ABIP34_21460 [Rhodoferax sp.]|uniref:hypothetical protein n=1 Tax=Rhodoferax sp. TaxID=50421 RepID=UPI003265E004